MPTANQLAGVAAYRTNRATRERAERELLDTMARLGDARAAREAALASGDKSAVAYAEQQVKTLEERRSKTASARDQARIALSAARLQALDQGDGFDLLSARHPLLLLPVRIETRFAWLDANGAWTFDPAGGGDRALLVRVYPDDLHRDSHEPELTADELRLLKAFERQLQAARDLIHLDNAWSDLIRRVGAPRAAWLGEVLARGQVPGRRGGRLSRPAVARVLPDRWMAVADLDDGSRRIEFSRPVQEPLETGPSPDGMRWMIDFRAALDAGMALVIRQIPAALEEVHRLVVLGARGTLDPGETAAELDRLLDANHYTGGLSFLPPGTPTNSIPGVRAGATTRPSLEDVVSLERRRFLIGMRPSRLCAPGDRSDGAALAAALGTDVATFGFVAGADATTRDDARRVRSLFVTAARRQLGRLLNGILSEQALAEALDFAVSLVTPVGALPTLRVGSQPYGILPVLLRDDARIPPDSFEGRLLPVLDRLRDMWTQATAKVPWIGDPGSDPGDTLVRILQRDAVARRIAFRPMLGQQLADVMVGSIGGRSPVARQRARAAAVLSALGAVSPENSPLVHALHMDFAPALTMPIVEPLDAALASAQRAEHYLELVASLTPDLLLQHQYGAVSRPQSLLFSIARLAMLERADAAARETLIAAGADSTAWDDEEVSSGAREPLGTPLRRLEAPDPDDPLESIAFHLSELGARKWKLDDLRNELRWLKTRSAPTLEEIVRATLGLFTHRLDAWFTALAVSRLNELRNDVASMTGINVGAFGVVERIRQSPRRAVGGAGVFTDPLNGGYVHAPSVNQGATAAVLRSIHLAHAAAGHGEAFSVDLSSARVRLGLELLEGIREGQTLAALLGYRIEHQLEAEGLPQFIAQLRAVAPLVANRLTPSTQPVESIAASNVIDGLTLLEKSGYDGETDPATTTLWQQAPTLGALPSSTERAALDRVLLAARDALDSVSDLSLAESVFQAVQGNPVRAGGTVDGLSGAPVPPPDITLVQTPRSGVGVTHRVFVLLSDPDPAIAGWSATPRALAEPRLEAWARLTLPSPDHIGVRARLRDAAGVEIETVDDLTVASLLSDASDAGRPLGLSALDVVLSAEPHDRAQASSIEQRVVALVAVSRPVPIGGSIELLYDRSADWDETVFGLRETFEIGRQLRDAMTRGRPMAITDLLPSGTGATATVGTAELAGRAQAAVAALIGAQTAIVAARTSTDRSAIRDALFQADALGIAGAAPANVVDALAGPVRDVDTRTLRAQVEAVRAELARRSAALQGVDAFDSLGRLRAVFGDLFVVLPTFEPASEATTVFGPAAAPAGADGASTRTWLSRIARVREPMRALDALLGYAEAVAVTTSDPKGASTHVGQLNGAQGERWVGLAPDPGSVVPAGRISLVAVAPAGDVPTDVVAGLMVDEWVEVVPSVEETTSVAFNYDAPGSTAPQVWLLGVPPAGLETWTSADALRVVDEALALARIRLVDGDDLSDLGQLLPAFVTAENADGDAIGLDVETLTRRER